MTTEETYFRYRSGLFLVSNVGCFPVSLGLSQNFNDFLSHEHIYGIKLSAATLLQHCCNTASLGSSASWPPACVVCVFVLQNWINDFLSDVDVEPPKLPARQLKLDRHGLPIYTYIHTHTHTHTVYTHTHIHTYTHKHTQGSRGC